MSGCQPAAAVGARQHTKRGRRDCSSRKIHEAFLDRALPSGWRRDYSICGASVKLARSTDRQIAREWIESGASKVLQIEDGAHPWPGSQTPGHPRGGSFYS